MKKKPANATKAKTPVKQRKPSDLPPRPPQDLHEAVLFGAASEATPEVIADYVRSIYGKPEKMTEAEHMRSCKAIMIMATVGFAFMNWQTGRAEK